VVQATQSFGQGLTATALQVAAGYGALANGGLLMKPYLVAKVVDPDGVVLLENHPTPVRQAVSEKTAKAVLAMLEGVVTATGGTAPRARMDEYRVAGKTGTAQKADPLVRGYSDKRIASFVGVVPAEAPRVVILVVIDEPRTDAFGGLVAAPAFREIASQAMATLGVPPSREVPMMQVANRKEPEPPSRSPLVAAIERVQDMDVVTEQVADGAVRVPDLTGSPGRLAVASLLTVALQPHLSGSGRVVTQRPSAGTLVERGTRVSLELASPLPPPR
jgi:cell division protein FtsI (penicillin-binding protein 3)